MGKPGTAAYPIGRFELIFCFAFWIINCVASIWVGCRASRGLTPWISHYLVDSPYTGELRYDKSDLEWYLHKRVVFQLVCVFVVHSVVFRLSHLFYQSYRYLTQLFLILFWSFITIFLTSKQCFALILIHAVLLITICSYLRKELIAWLSCISLVVYANKYAFFSPEPETFYLEYTIYLYTAVQILNVCIYLCRNPSQHLTLELVLDIFEYLLYPMYSMTLIVLFQDFQQQTHQLRFRSMTGDKWLSTLSFKQLLVKAARLLFWYAFIEAFLHLIYANAVVLSPFTLISGLNNYEVSSVAYMSGVFFHLKYVIIFGVPSLFAFIDGMTPPGPPVCISRISKYSQMWRYFDRGLYEFLKHQVYIPFMGNTTGFQLAIRRLCAMVGVFGFVLAWHGTKSNYLMWVLLSAFEIVAERVGRYITDTKQWKTLSNKVGEANELRIKAIAMIFTIIPGLLGVFFFLSQVGTGDEIMQKLLIQGVTQLFLEGNISYGSPGGVLAHMLILGYFYNHCCLYLEYKMHPNNSKVKRD